MKTLQAGMLMSLLMLLQGCTPPSAELAFGQDACAHCKMKLMDPHFGAVMVTDKGRVFKFDDLNCMFRFSDEFEGEITSEFDFRTVDYEHPGKLIDARSAFYLKSEQLHTPMDGEVAAFSNQKSFQAAKKKFPGVYLVWGELTTQHK